MRKPKRRRRDPDRLASPHAVREVLVQLRRRLPDIIPEKEKDLVALLRASLHAEKYPASDTRRGRPARWPREELLRVMPALRAVLGRGTGGRTDARTFVDHYLPILAFPADVCEALEGGEVSLFEAEQLARLSPKRLGASASAARSARTRLLRAHLESQEPCGRLRMRVSALLGGEIPGRSPENLLPSSEFSRTVPEAAAHLADEIAAKSGSWPNDLTVETDPGHLFYDHLRMIAQALQEMEPDDLMEKDMERLYAHGDEILLVLQQVKRRKQSRARLMM